jgi:hypothetical protein
MKHYLCYLLFSLLSFPLFSFAQKTPIITFDNKVCDFGRVKYNPKSVIKIKFYYKNTGNAPLVIYKVDASCGCAVPYWNKKPISKGMRDYIFVVLNMKRKGFVKKTLYVSANANTKRTVLHINGELN